MNIFSHQLKEVVKPHPQCQPVNLGKLSIFAGMISKARPGTALALFLIYFLGICIKTYAVEPPEIAIIQSVYGSRLTVFPNGRNSPPETAKEGIELREFRGILAVPGNDESKAGLMLVNSRRQSVSSTAQTLFMAGPQNTPTEYSLSCKIAVGSATVGFSQGQAPCDKGVVVTPYRNIVGQFPTFKPVEITQNLKTFLKAQASFESIQYCSVATASGRGWGVSASQNPSDDPCQQAREKCIATSDQDCEVVSLGEWNRNDSDVVASVQCANNLAFTRRGNGQEVGDELLPLLEQMSKSLNASSCAFHVYSGNDIVVSPASNDPTLVQVFDAGGGNLAIDVLVGDVKIVSARRPQGLLIQEGFGYRQDRDGLTRIDCPERFNSESMQDFLRPANWSQSGRSIATQLAEYRADFCQSAGRSERPSPNIDLPRIPIPFPFPRPRDDNDSPRNPRDSIRGFVSLIPIASLNEL